MTLKIKNLSKKTGEVWELRDISFEVKKGEIMGFFGTSEHEISSLFEVLAGLEEKDNGEITFDGEDYSGAFKRKTEFHFPNNKSTNSIFGSIFKSKSSTDKKPDFDEFTQNAEKVLLLENPINLRVKNSEFEKTETFQKKVKEKDISVIFSSNGFEDIFAFCDRVVIFHNGKIIQTGTPREVYEKPNSVVVAEITGRNNLFTARRISSTKKETPEFQTIEGEHRLFTDRFEKKELGAINQNITLAIRPEHISISFGASFPADNLLKAQIIGIKYLGATTLIKLEANGLPLEALVLRLVGLNIGDECVVGLPPERILVLKD